MKCKHDEYQWLHRHKEHEHKLKEYHVIHNMVMKNINTKPKLDKWLHNINNYDII